MTTMHTEGPFFVKHGENGFFEIMDGENSDTANTLCTRFEWKEREAEMRANGNLFAAARDLLSALESAVSALSDVDADRFNIDMDAISLALSSASAAIAKATTP